MIQPKMAPDRNPLEAPLVLADGIAVLSGQVGAEDREFLSGLGPKGVEIAFGAVDCLIYPFTCRFEGREGPTAARVLEAVGARWFQSQHIADLNQLDLPYTGYKPGTKNDEIHTDPDGQQIFSKDAGEDAATFELHLKLRSHVVDERLFYVLLHDKPEDGFSLWVTLFAIGVSPASGNLVGIVTHQMCHNFCD